MIVTRKAGKKVVILNATEKKQVVSVRDILEELAHQKRMDITSLLEVYDELAGPVLAEEEEDKSDSESKDNAANNTAQPMERAETAPRTNGTQRAREMASAAS